MKKITSVENYIKDFPEPVRLRLNEIDYYWSSFTKDGQEEMCGWCKDKFGVSWQIVPTVLGKLMNDPAKGQRVMNAFLKMRKFDIAALENA